MGQHKIHKYLHYRVPRMKREMTWENIWRDNSWKLPQHGKGNNQPCTGSRESPRGDKSKEEHTEPHGNQTDKN